jgi:hypothetical protein
MKATMLGLEAQDHPQHILNHAGRPGGDHRQNALNAFHKKGAEILFVAPPGIFCRPGIYTCMGYLMLFFEQIGIGFLP